MKVTLTLTEACNLACKALNTVDSNVPCHIEVTEVTIDAISKPYLDWGLLESIAKVNKIQCVKFYRIMTGLGLAQSKEDVEARFQKLYWADKSVV